MNKIWKTICDWCWWRFVIKQNEFHPGLNIDWNKITNDVSIRKEIKRITKDRERAHNLELRWGK